MADPLAPGSVFGAYRVERLIGRGGMSAVYLAHQEGLQRKVALKVLSAELAEDERFRERFIRESRIAASLEDPNVLPIYEAGEHDGILFIAMRYVDGTDLKRLIDEEGPLGAARTARIVDQVARALEAAHAQGLVHRDVKPANVLLTPASGSRGGSAYLADFGLSKRWASDSGLTGTGVFAGTLNYAAPEQFEGRPLDARTDVYSLGCVLFECLTGSPPFVKEQDAALMYAHLHEPVPSAVERRPELPASVDAVIATAMTKAPEGRYASAGELAAAFREAVEPRAAGAPSPRGRRRAAGVLVSTGIVAAGLLLLVATRGDDGGKNTTPTPNPSASGSSGGPPAGSLVRLDPDRGEVTLTVPDVPGLHAPGAVPVRPNLALGEGGVWLYSYELATAGRSLFLAEFDDGTGAAVGDPIPVPFEAGVPAALVVGSRTVWYIGGAPQLVSRINPSTHELLDPVSIPTGVTTDMALDGDALWVSSSDGTITRFDALTGRRLDRIAVEATPDAIAVAEGSVWIVDALGGRVLRADIASGETSAEIAVSGNLDDIAAGDGGIWVLDGAAGTATRIDPRTNTALAPLRVGPDPSALTVGFGSAWVADGQDGLLYRLDPALGVQPPIDVGAPLAAVAIDEVGESLWVAVFDTPI